MSASFARYRRRYTVAPQSETLPIANVASLAVVIPVHDEPDPIRALACVRRCEVPASGADIILVVNGSDDPNQDRQNGVDRNWLEVSQWVERVPSDRLRFHAIDARGLPRKRAGVGLARKIGMDAAACRMDAGGCLDRGAIACLDADCEVDPDYLLVLDRWRCAGQEAGAALHFEHPLAEAQTPLLRQAITEYELGLRYYVLGVGFAGFPFNYHTVGSSMAVRSSAYLDVGGMNQRKAGEDFYFLHKVASYGGVARIGDTVVRPSPRISHRVPFGTGRALGKAADIGDPTHRTYPWEAFESLAGLGASLREACAKGVWSMEGLPEPMSEYAIAVGLETQLREALVSSPDPGRRWRASLQRIDAFWVMKWLNHARDQHFGSRPVVIEAARAWKAASMPPTTEERAAGWLMRYREHDRANRRPTWGGDVVSL